MKNWAADSGAAGDISPPHHRGAEQQLEKLTYGRRPFTAATA